jgi:hypothetical protein
VSDQAAPELPAGPQDAKPEKPERLDRTVLRLSTDELVRLAPRLRPYLATPVPTWPGVVDAADWLRGELGVSKSLWGEACLAMGREEAAIAVAIVSAKPTGHFRSSPGGYFHGMVAKASPTSAVSYSEVWDFNRLGCEVGTTFGVRRSARGAVPADAVRGGRAVRPGRDRGERRSAGAARAAAQLRSAGRGRCW